MFKTLFCRFPGIFNKKTTFKEFKEIHKEYEIQYNDEKGTIYSNINLLKNVRINLGVDCRQGFSELCT